MALLEFTKRFNTLCPNNDINRVINIPTLLLRKLRLRVVHNLFQVQS